MSLIAPLNLMPPIPVGKHHPGSFGIDRHKHVHTGVDLYAPHGCPVRAMEAGRVIAIKWFTGPTISMPWWNDTRAVYIEGATGVFNYGEIQEIPGLFAGATVLPGQVIGYIVTVLRKYKGRPMSMLHVELYNQGIDYWDEWKIGDPKPDSLMDPTAYLLTIPGSTSITEDPYIDSVQLYNSNKEK